MLLSIPVFTKPLKLYTAKKGVWFYAILFFLKFFSTSYKK